jgi:hypothetical protein
VGYQGEARSDRLPETPARDFRRVNGANVSRAGFQNVSCAALLVVLGPRSGQEKAKSAFLFRPVMRQTSRQGDEARRRQLDRVLTGEDGPDNLGREIRQAQQHGQIVPPQAQPYSHRFNTVVVAGEEHRAHSDGFGDERGEAAVDGVGGAMADHEPYAFSLASDAGGNRQRQRLGGRSGFHRPRRPVR